MTDPGPSRKASEVPLPDALASGVFRQLDRARLNWNSLAKRLDTYLWAQMVPVLVRSLNRCPDPDMALNALDRMIEPAGEYRLRQVASLIEHRGRPLESLVILLGTSAWLGDLLTRHPAFFSRFRPQSGLKRSPTRDELEVELRAELDRALVEAPSDDGATLRAFRRFRLSHMLRVGINDVLRDRPIEEITRDLSRVADTSIQIAYERAWRVTAARFGEPVAPDGEKVRGCCLAFGKLGGEELNYSSDIDLMFLFDREGTTQGGRMHLSAGEFFAKLSAEVIRLLAAPSDAGAGYRVDLRLRPDGGKGPVARDLLATMAYYDSMGRTWERQALIKVRPVAGDVDLGREFLQAIEPFIYRKYLSFAEINEIKALKRRIETRAKTTGGEDLDVKTGRGGIRDIEYTVQFLQLANGGDLSALRLRGTLPALLALERAGCLTDQEYRLLDQSYRFLRKTEHRLQMLFDLQVHRLPEDAGGLERLARRMGLGGLEDGTNAADAFMVQFRSCTGPTRAILDHLLHQSFATDERQAEPETDLVLDPDTDPAEAERILRRHHFNDPVKAIANLALLAREPVPFLSAKRCRHFLASIAPQLLRALSQAPDPDMALANLERVTASLGARAELYELFRLHPPSLRLMVDLCAWSQFLSEIMITNPGMADELLDTLVLDQPPTREMLDREVTTLLKGAEDPETILSSFQDKEFLRVGVRDILGKDDARATSQALTDIAEVILGALAQRAEMELNARSGTPNLTEGPRAGQHCRWAIVALGRLGAREMSYHSDLDIIVLYEGAGRFAWEGAGQMGGSNADCHHHFTELAQRVIRYATQQSQKGQGRLYSLDMRLRPTGRSGSLVLSLPEFSRYHGAGGNAQLWERIALVRARVVHGDPDFVQEVRAALARATQAPWPESGTREMLAMRQRLEASRPERDLKRGQGGLTDIEFITTILQCKNASGNVTEIEPNTLDSISKLEDLGLLDILSATQLREAHAFLNHCLMRLRIVHNRAFDELPADPAELEKLRRRLGPNAPADLSAHIASLRSRTRSLFVKLLS